MAVAVSHDMAVGDDGGSGNWTLGVHGRVNKIISEIHTAHWLFQRRTEWWVTLVVMTLQ